MHSRDLIKPLLKDGWYEVNQVGSHKQFKRPTKRGQGDGATPEPGRPDRHPQKYQETGGSQPEVIPTEQGSKGAHSWNISPIFIRTGIRITA